MKKKIAITGLNSYIGSSFENWIAQWPNQYDIEKISLRTEEWMEQDFSRYDVILHVAGIAHVTNTSGKDEIYDKINRELAEKVAAKAKSSHVKQFIFLSSMIIYGTDEQIDQNKVITMETPPNPSDVYGKSKLMADMSLQKLGSASFKVAIVRVPMVYGPNCKGNFSKLLKLAKYSPIFPDIQNQRSMIYIYHLCQFFKDIIDNEKHGIFFPQNKEYAATKDIMRIIASMYNRKIRFISFFNPVIKIIAKKVRLLNKMLGSKVYDKSLSGDFSYCFESFEESIKKCCELERSS